MREALLHGREHLRRQEPARADDEDVPEARLVGTVAGIEAREDVLGRGERRGLLAGAFRRSARAGTVPDARVRPERLEPIFGGELVERVLGRVEELDVARERRAREDARDPPLRAAAPEEV